MGRPKKNEAAKGAEADSGNLPWTESMDLCLLKLVNQFGAHLIAEIEDTFIGINSVENMKLENFLSRYPSF